MLAFENMQTKQSITYFFRVLDYANVGYLSADVIEFWFADMWRHLDGNKPVIADIVV